MVSTIDIVKKQVVKSVRGGMDFRRIPMAQVFALRSEPLMDSLPPHGDLHSHLLRVAVAGLWQLRSKHPIYVGYQSVDDVIRLCLIAHRTTLPKAFYDVVRQNPGYLEFGQELVDLLDIEPLAYWEYPCSAYAIRRSVADESAPDLNGDFPSISKEGMELEGFKLDGTQYWMIHRSFKFV